MPRARTPIVRALLVVLAVVVAVVVLRALAATEADGAPAGPPAPAGAGATPSPPPGGAHPARIRVPRIEVDAAVVDLGLAADRTLEVPEDVHTTGWWSGGTRPGGAGPAVVVGHVDSETGPAVFYRLRDLEAGDVIEVVGDGGEVLPFTVDGVLTVPKDGFPTASVYGPTDGPALRLVTCGGDFDEGTQHYRENTIAYASYGAA